MAIKTKKITDLGQIQVSYSENGTSTLDIADFYLIGCQSGVTGKVSTAEIAEVIRSLIGKATDPSVLSSYVGQSTDQIDELNNVISDLVIKVDDLTNRVTELETKSSSYEKFIQELQKDGYLTLAEIKKAAADACPICTHTHEEETTTEA